MPSCLQCGKCCLGLDWTFNFEANGTDPISPDKTIMDAAEQKMNSYGLYFHKFKSSEFKDGWWSLTFGVGICQHLMYDNGKAHCKNHENRSPACKGYFCDKAKEKN
jgi:hypothetical protein